MTRFEDGERPRRSDDASRDDLAMIDTIAELWSPPRRTPGERLAFRERVMDRAERSPWYLLPGPARRPAALLTAAVALFVLVQAFPWSGRPTRTVPAAEAVVSDASSWERDLFDPPELDVWSLAAPGLEPDMLPEDYVAIESAFL
jgi:hypothetical protein